MLNEPLFANEKKMVECVGSLRIGAKTVRGRTMVLASA